jgi:hypothetical protein
MRSNPTPIASGTMMLLVRLALLSSLAAGPGACQDALPGGGGEAGGGTWEPELRLTDRRNGAQTTYNFARSIAVDPASGIHVVWHEARGGQPRVFHRRSPDEGASWDGDIELSPPSFPAEHPSVACGESDVYVVYHSYRPQAGVYLRRSRDGGRTWDAEQPLGERTAHGSVAVSGSLVHVVSGGGDAGNHVIQYRRSLDGGATWLPVVRLVDSPFPAWVPSIAASGPYVYLAYVDARDGNEEEYLKVSTDGGATWGEERRLTVDPANSWAPSMAVAGPVVHHFWFDQRDAGTSLTECENVLDVAMRTIGIAYAPQSRLPGPGYFYDDSLTRLREKTRQVMGAAPEWIARGGDAGRLNRVMGRYFGMLGAAHREWEIYYQRSMDAGATWSPVRRLTVAEGMSQRPSVAMSGNALHVAWFDDRDGNVEVYTKSSPDAGVTWGPDVRLTAAPGDSSRPHLAVSSRHVHVAWFDARDGASDIFYRRRALSATPCGAEFANAVSPAVGIAAELRALADRGIDVRRFVVELSVLAPLFPAHMERKRHVLCSPSSTREQIEAIEREHTFLGERFTDLLRRVREARRAKPARSPGVPRAGSARSRAAGASRSAIRSR